ncbi:hypothetical protein PAM7971_03043 [Pacificibacter marinus]|uniref:Uncharacterized protein n=1 Tax=Pacificibacter marinus TaxID=658057 RepID=A0A1Y5TF24_9RHOB|nr:hypothetical protein PAM7971_03043 [Pacificibacter marinus]
MEIGEDAPAARLMELVALGLTLIEAQYEGQQALAT